MAITLAILSLSVVYDIYSQSQIPRLEEGIPLNPKPAFGEFERFRLTYVDECTDLPQVSLYQPFYRIGIGPYHYNSVNPGNEEADKPAAFASALGQFSLQEQTVTEGGIRQASKDLCSKARTAPSFGVRRPEWNCCALSAYTWPRTDRGPQKYWLSQNWQSRAAESSSCPHTQDGQHITFVCPVYNDQRSALGGIKDWEDLDRPIWIKEEEGEV
ncbi:hypothetical protein L211DRAFT_866125 [Terfezia boudieri ATCC MYA-4762]|uniref:Uncharacterized protein n=1 Tax=Terfezia boudieri ATCC MYA-4762 TaxID=1051890 RepID=A0A3N4M1J2_9PEZI|nr:hypothetical protein L211DRAFT_866125 [Terfezia boudieri ATCC MYA-4762]